MKRITRLLSSIAHWLLELSLVRIIPSRPYYLVGIVLSGLAGYVTFECTNKFLNGVLGGALTLDALLVIKYSVESLYLGLGTQRAMRAIEGRPVIFQRAFRKLASDAMTTLGKHLAILGAGGSLPFGELTLNEQLAVIGAMIEKAFGWTSRGVEIYHTWNNEAFPVEEYWPTKPRDPVRTYLDNLVTFYREQRVGTKMRLFVLDAKALAQLRGGSLWQEIKDYHADHRIEAKYWSPEEFNKKRKQWLIPYIDCTVVISDKHMFALAVSEKEPQAKLVEFLSSGDQIAGLVEFLRDARRNAHDLFGP